MKYGWAILLVLIPFVHLLSADENNINFTEQYFSFDPDSIPISQIINFIYLDKAMYSQITYNNMVDILYNRKALSLIDLDIIVNSHSKNIFSDERLALEPDILNFKFDMGYYKLGNFLFNFNIYMKSYSYFYNDMDYLNNDSDEEYEGDTPTNLDTVIIGSFDTGGFSTTFGYKNKYFTPIVSIFDVSTDHYYSDFVELMPDSLQNIYNDRYLEVRAKIFDSGLLTQTDINSSEPQICYMGYSSYWNFGLVYSDYFKMIDLRFLKAYSVDRLARDYSRAALSITATKKIFMKNSDRFKLPKGLDYEILFNYLGLSFNDFSDVTSRVNYNNTFKLNILGFQEQSKNPPNDILGFYCTTTLGLDYNHTEKILMKANIALRPGLNIETSKLIYDAGIFVGFSTLDTDSFPLDSDNLYPDRFELGVDIGIYFK